MRENLTSGSVRGRWKRSGPGSRAPMRGHRLERAETEQPYDTLSPWEHRHRASDLLYSEWVWVSGIGTNHGLHGLRSPVSVSS
jgi:hypothetical protein